MATRNRTIANLLFQGTASQFLAANSTPAASWISPAAQADQETGTDLTKPITAGVEQYHQSSAKCWGFTKGAGTPVLNAVSYNITSITDAGTGLLTVTIGNDFSSNAFVQLSSCLTTGTGATMMPVSSPTAAGSYQISSLDVGIVGNLDPGVGYIFANFGDLP